MLIFGKQMVDYGKVKLAQKIAQMTSKTLFAGLMEKIILPAQQVSAVVKLQNVQYVQSRDHWAKKLIKS